jgi:hypothetical protein
MPTAPKPVSDRESYKELAEQVIRQALADATSPTVSRAVRNSARQFLEGSPALRQWCDIANLPFDAVIEHARHVLMDVPHPRHTRSMTK